MKKTSLIIVLALSMVIFAGCQSAPASSAAASASQPAASAAQSVASTGKVIEPLPTSLDMANLDNCSFAASFPASAIELKDGMLCITMTVYDCDRFDIADIAQLAPGDTIVINGENIVVDSVEKKDSLVIINGGIEQGGYELYTEENSIYMPTEWDGVPLYHVMGEVTLPVAQEFEYIDYSDMDNPKKYLAGDLITDISTSNEEFTQMSTGISVEDGKIIEMVKVYMP